MTLVEFLLARIAEDEAGIRAEDFDLARIEGVEIINEVGRERMLRECEAKRRIVGLHDNRCADCGSGRRCISHDVSAGEPSVRYRDPVDWLTLTALAAVHADHPDYDPAWAAG